jgi:hypothetical protein
MIDLETASSRAGGAILSIAAVTFDREKPLGHRGMMGPVFRQNVDFQDCIDRGMAVDASTIDWWMSNDAEVWQSIREDAVPLRVALAKLNGFLSSWTEDRQRTWAKGSDFEFGLMLRPAYDRVDVNMPWHYRDLRCLRTLEVDDHHDPDVPHDPVSDAKAQARDVIHHFDQYVVDSQAHLSA